MEGVNMRIRRNPPICLGLVPALSLSAAILIGSACGASRGEAQNLTHAAEQHPASTGDWTWMAGSDLWDQVGAFGEKGIGSPGNAPGARELAASWTGADGSLWLFGGLVEFPGNMLDDGNDLWKYDTANQEWTWVAGSTFPAQRGIYGTRGKGSPSNIPGAREGATTWTDSFGNLWLFGGIAYDSLGNYLADINDLWKYSPESGEWTWVSGNHLNSINDFAAGVYGTKGVPGAANLPGARDSAAHWIDSKGNLWLFGGFGLDSTRAYGPLNDLWEFNPRESTWTWVSGSNTTYALASYGVQGVPSLENVPQARERVASWVDESNNLWLFGGFCWSPGVGMINDLWKFDPATKMWTWVGGSSEPNEASVYGVKGEPAAGNIPSGRERSVAWRGRSGNFWLYGGEMEGGSVAADLWKYEPSTNRWAWVGGTSAPGVAGVYGTKGTPKAANFPGSRSDAAAWTNEAGNLWLFGGEQDDRSGEGLLNDLWRYQP